MYAPLHPGRVLRETCLDGIPVPEAAARMGVAPEILEPLLQGTRPISPDLALRLEAAGWSNAEFWMRLQAYYDLAQERLRQRTRQQRPCAIGGRGWADGCRTMIPDCT